VTTYQVALGKKEKVAATARSKRRSNAF